MSPLQRNGTDIKATGNSVTDQTTVCKCPFSKGMGQILRPLATPSRTRLLYGIENNRMGAWEGGGDNSMDSVKEEEEKTATFFLQNGLLV